MSLSYQIDISSVEKLEDFSRDISKILKKGDVLALNGDIGAGKTTFTQHLFKNFGLDAKVCSPTFNIVLSYETSGLRLHHADLYRIDYEEELENIGFDEVFGSDGILVVEWADRMKPYLMSYADSYLELNFELGTNNRTCSFEGELAGRYLILKGDEI